MASRLPRGCLDPFFSPFLSAAPLHSNGTMRFLLLLLIPLRPLLALSLLSVSSVTYSNGITCPLPRSATASVFLARLREREKRERGEGIVTRRFSVEPRSISRGARRGRKFRLLLPFILKIERVGSFERSTACLLGEVEKLGRTSFAETSFFLSSLPILQFEQTISAR